MKTSSERQSALCDAGRIVGIGMRHMDMNAHIKWIFSTDLSSNGSLHRLMEALADQDLKGASVEEETK